MSEQQLFNLAHQWAQEAYMKGLGKPCDIDGAREAFARALDAEISRLRETQRVLVEALRELVQCHGGGGFVQPDEAVLNAAHAALASVETPESVHLASAGGTEDTARDALRYRWWRAYVVGDDCSYNDAFIECETAEDFDALTDSAMSTEPKP